jgi:uncharacterized protein (TIGR02217 family)
MSFLETPPFPGCPSFGYVSEPRYSVSVTQRAGGHERRNANWSRPLHRYTLTVGPRMEAEIAELLEFWHAVGGTAYGFRFKDFADFQSCRSGSTIAATDQPLIVTADSPSAYQMTKRYTWGARTQDRDIVKPVSGTILVADGGVLKTETTHYVVDYTTGIVDINFSPSGALTWGGEFDVPARFDSEFPVEIVTRRIESAQFAVAEIRL